MRSLVHGESFTLYANGCRCDKCREYQNGRNRRNRADRLARIEVHGIRSSYDAGCRCADCKSARREAYQRLASEHAGAYAWRKSAERATETAGAQ